MAKIRFVLPTLHVWLKELILYFRSNQNKNCSELVSFSHVVGQCLGRPCVAKTETGGAWGCLNYLFLPPKSGDTDVSELQSPDDVYSSRHHHRLQSSVSWYMPFWQNRAKEGFILKLLLMMELLHFMRSPHWWSAFLLGFWTLFTVSDILLSAELKWCLIGRRAWAMESQYLDNSHSFIKLEVSSKTQK